MPKLNLGCGPYKLDGFINIDKNPIQDADMTIDVRKGLPFENDSIDLIEASHFMEHLDCDEMLDLMEESYRVLKQGSHLRITVPIMDFSAIDHKQFFEQDAFDIFERDATKYFGRKFDWKVASKTMGAHLKGQQLTIVLKK